MLMNPSNRLRSLTVLGAAALVACWASGCGGRRWQMRQAQLQTMEIYRYSQNLNQQLAQSQQYASQLAANLESANQRLANLTNERSQLHDQYKNLLTGLTPGENPLNSAASRKLADLASRYPDFEFDPMTGVCRFNGDLMFASGSDEIRPKGRQILDEFSRIMNDPETQQFQVLVVGHTDDMPIAKPGTRQNHPTNWDLSVHRATSVVKTLAKTGMSEPRLGAAGYSMFHEATPNTSDSSRQQNRRVEIFVLAPDATIASVEPGIRR